MTDSERLDWLEANHTLHRSVELLYVVDGYEGTLMGDGNPFAAAVHGQSIREVIDGLAALREASQRGSTQSTETKP